MINSEVLENPFVVSLEGIQWGPSVPNGILLLHNMQMVHSLRLSYHMEVGFVDALHISRKTSENR